MNLNISEIIKIKSVRQTLAVSSSNLFTMGIGFVINVVLAKEMGLAGFGLYSFTFAVFSFVALFMEFGFYSTSAKVLADEVDEIKERRLLGGIFLVYLLINLFFSLLMYFIGCFIDNFFVDKIGSSVKNVAFSGYAYTAPFFMEWILQGCNRIYLLSQYNFMGKSLHCIFLFFIWHQNQLTPDNVLISYAIAYGISIFVCYMRMKPIFSDSIKVFEFLYKSNKIYGWPQYIGRIVAVGSSDIYRVFISYFVDAKSVGLYSLAMNFVSVVNVLGNGIGIAKFKSFAKESNIGNRLVRSMRVTSFLSAILVVLVAYCVIFFYLGESYYNVCIYIALLVFGGVAKCNYTLYVSWLTSHGCAKQIRKTLFRMGLVNFGLGIVFTYFFSVIGTCLAFSLGYCYIYYLYVTIYTKLTEKEF